MEDHREMPQPDELIDYLRRASVAVYIAMDAVAADDLSPHLNAAADEIDRQESAIAVLEQENEAMRHEIERLRRRDLQWAADVVWRSEWMTRAVNLLGEIREALEYELGESGHLAELEDLLHDEFEDGDSDDD